MRGGTVSAKIKTRHYQKKSKRPKGSQSGGKFKKSWLVGPDGKKTGAWKKAKTLPKED